MTTMTDTIRAWRVTAGDRTYTGSASTAAAAWTNAAVAALQLAHHTDGALALHLSVDDEGEPAAVEPARTEHGALDAEATRVVLARFVEVVLASRAGEGRFSSPT